VRVNHRGLHIGVSQQFLLSQFALPPKSIKQLCEMFADRRDDRRRQDRHAIPSTLRVAHDDFAAVEQEILGA